jgi:UDP:flavonoid glycosyltransferase YjiC (YdhE family)
MPDVILASHLTLGPVAIAASRQIPLVVIGPIVYAFPFAGEMPFPDFESARNAAWHWAELRHAYRNACRELDLKPNDENLLGDRYLLQGVPELDPKIVERLPARVKQVGPCLIDAPRLDRGDVEAWIGEQRAGGRTVAFVQLERTFGIRDPWPVLATWAAAQGVALVASLERHRARDRQPAGTVLIRNGVALEYIAPHVDFAICSGTPSSLLAAVMVGKPTLIACAGSGTNDDAAAFERYGSALAFDAAGADPEQIASLAQRLRSDPAFSQRARTLRAAFRDAQGPSRAADEIENIARIPTSPRS